MKGANKKCGLFFIQNDNKIIKPCLETCYRVCQPDFTRSVPSKPPHTLALFTLFFFGRAPREFKQHTRFFDDHLLFWFEIRISWFWKTDDETRRLSDSSNSHDTVKLLFHLPHYRSSNATTPTVTITVRARNRNTEVLGFGCRLSSASTGQSCKPCVALWALLARSRCNCKENYFLKHRHVPSQNCSAD